MNVLNFPINPSIQRFQTFEARRKYKKENKSKLSSIYRNCNKPIGQKDVSRQVGIPFALKKVPFIPCPLCNSRILTNDEVSLIAKRLSERRGERLALALKEKIHLLKPVAFNISNAIIKAAPLNPQANLKELLSIVEPEFRAGFVSLCKKIIKKAKSVNPKIKNSVYFDIQDSLNLTEIVLNEGKQNYDINISRTFWINKILDLKKTCNNSEDLCYLNKILAIVSKLPYTNDNEGAFIKTNKIFSSYEIGKQLFSPVSGSVDHIVAESKGGANTIDNLVLTCCSCNEKKSDHTLNQVIDETPSVAVFFQKYIDAVIHSINRQIVNGFDQYPEKIKQTLIKESSHSGNPDDASIVLNISGLNIKG